MLIDFFPFVNEFEVLEIRLHELFPIIDKIVIVESEETFSGIEKPLQFERNKSRFKQFMSKIVYIVPPKTNLKLDAWHRQMYQRDYAINSVACADDDLILISDVDEIVSKKGLEAIVYDDNNCADKIMQTFVQRYFVYFLNRRRPGGWPGPVLLPYRLLKERYNGSLYEARMRRRKGRKVKGNGRGWHFSNLGGYDNVVRKLKASCHYNSKTTRQMLNDPELLKDRVMGEGLVKRRKLVTEPITTEMFPEWLVENIERFDHLIFKEE